MTGPGGLGTQFTNNVLDMAGNEEMTEHLKATEATVSPKDGETSNVRNRTTPKTVLTHATGQIELDVPRDREGHRRTDHRG